MTIYRQRLTGLGWGGATLFIVAQICGGFALNTFVREPLDRWGDPTTAGVIAAACGVAMFASLVMILVGRESFPVTPIARDERKPEPEMKAWNPYPDKKSVATNRTEEHFGKSAD